jgi:hypothetical protein
VEFSVDLGTMFLRTYATKVYRMLRKPIAKPNSSLSAANKEFIRANGCNAPTCACRLTIVTESFENVRKQSLSALIIFLDWLKRAEQSLKKG